MSENILDVRLLHAAKTLTAWNNTTSVPKMGEVCLEIQGNTPPLSYKIKIGDGTTSYTLLPYFGSIINTNGNASVVAVDTVTDGGVTKKVLKFYKLTLTTSTIDGITTVSPAIGDLILTIQEGTGINFATNATDTLVEVELEAVTADTAQTITDGGTFTAVTKDSNDKATKYTTFTLPSITNKINELDVADNTVITAEWDNTNKQIKLYYTKETDGKIQKGSLAYTIDAIDIAPVQSITEGTKIDVSSSNGNYTITHENTTRTDTTSTKKSFGDSFVTGVSTDTTGHVTGVETSQLPDNPVIGLDMSDPTASGNGLTFIDTISQSSGQVTATKKTVQDGNTTQKGVVQLQDSVDTNNTKAVTPNAVKNYTDTKITDAIEDLDSSQSADANNVLTSITQTDGKLTGKTQVSYTTIAPVQNVTTTDTGDSGLEVTTSNNVKDVHHKTVAQNDTDNSSIIGEKELPIITGVNVDSYGHVTGVTKDVSTNLIAADIKAPIKQTDNSMWNHRVTGGTINIGEDTAKINPIKGNTIVWNQMTRNGDFNGNIEYWSSYNSNNVSVAYGNRSIIATLNSSGYGFSFGIIQTFPASVANHKYFVKYNVKPSVDTTFGSEYANINISIVTCPANVFTTVKGFIISVSSDNTPFIIKPTSELNIGDTYEIKDVIVIDLTKMFGSGNEPATVEEFEAMFPNSYYPYNEGELISLFDNSKSFNIWDEEWESGHISDTTGEVISNVQFICSKNLIPVSPNTAYYLKASNALDKYAYDVNKTLIGFFSASINSVFITGPNTYYIAFNTHTPNEVTTYNNDICINISNPEYNGLYLPYGEPLPAGVKSVGFNLWDEDWERGTFNLSTLEFTPSATGNFIISKNFCDILSNTTYYTIAPYNISVFGLYRVLYDANKNALYRESYTAEFTTPQNARYFKIAVPIIEGAYGSLTYNNDICINLSDPSRNGTYEPYKETTLDLSWIKSIKDNEGNQLFPNGLLSAGNVYDEVGEDYAIKRVGVVDLGSLTWYYYNQSTYPNIFITSLNGIKQISSGDVGNLKIILYTAAAAFGGGMVNKTIRQESASNNILICDETYTDKDVFKSAMSGVLLYYELATPITITFDRKPLSYTVDDLGTETLLPEGIGGTTATPLSAPFNGQFEYKSNFKDTVLDLVERVNNARNPVKGVTNTNQTVDKLAVYDSAETVKSSNYSPSNATIVEGATGNDIILPSVETIINYVNTKLSSALNYKGTISQWSDLPTSGQNTGDMYIADTTFTEGGVTYQAGDFFIWNGTDWDIVSGTTSVVDNNPTISLNGSTYQVGTVDGVALQVTTPNLDYSSPTASGTSLEYIDTVTQTDGQISATKKSLPNASTTQAGVTSFVNDIHYSTDNEKTATAKQIWVECEKRNVQFVESGVVPTELPMTEEEFINTYAYGVKWVQGGSECTRVGNSSLHETMPIHNALRACVYQIVPQEVTVTETIDGIDYTLNYGAKREFRYWLDDDDWNKKADGTPSVLTGEDMTGIAIWHRKFYGKSFDGVVDGSTSYNSVYVSLVQYDSTWTEIKEGYIDFAKMQTVSSNGVNYARSFGNPDFSVDNPSTTEMTLSAINTWIQTQKDSAQALTKSQVSLNRLTANQYAMNAGAHLMSLDEYKWIFCWLPVIECAAFTIEENTHFDWQDGSDTNVVMRDSLSNIPDWIYYGMYSANYSAITETCGWAFVPAGYTNKLGTHTGWIKMRLPNSGGTYDSKIASRWRGFEIQRNIWTNLIGVNPVQTNTSGTVDVYSTKNRALWNNNMPIDITDESASTHVNIMPWASRNTEEPEYTTLTGWEHKGIQKWNGYGTEFDLGSEGNPTYKTLGSSKPDNHYGYMSNANPRWFIAGGDADDASSGGPFDFYSNHPAGYASGDVSFRCCWNIDEYNSVLN